MRLIFYTVMCSDLVISAQRIEGPESFIIEIERSKVNGLLQEFEGEMSYLAQYLRLQDKRMVLINPVSLNLSIFQPNVCFFRNSKDKLKLSQKKDKMKDKMRAKLRLLRKKTNKVRRSKMSLSVIMMRPSPPILLSMTLPKMTVRHRPSQWRPRLQTTSLPPPPKKLLSSNLLHKRKRSSPPLLRKLKAARHRTLLTPQQQKTLNKNKLNKIIKLRIEFKFEKELLRWFR